MKLLSGQGLNFTILYSGLTLVSDDKASLIILQYKFIGI